MSADDGIYLRKFKDGWRVVHSQCVENAFESPKAMREYFSGSPLFKTEGKAWKYARKLQKEADEKMGTEYGIREI